MLLGSCPSRASRARRRAGPVAVAENKQGPRAWRWRRCPSCLAVERASAFSVAETSSAGWGFGSTLRRCPNCGQMGPTRDFVVVREAHG